MKLSKSLKRKLEQISIFENVSLDQLILSFLNTGINNYKNHGSIRRNAFDLTKFQDEIRVGDRVIASGILGTITKKSGGILMLEIAKGVEIEVVVDAVSDKKIVKRTRKQRAG